MSSLERWRWVPGHRGDHSVSSLGRVRTYLISGIASSHLGRRRQRPKICKGTVTKGYRKIYLQGHCVKVAVLVLLAFVGPRPLKPTRHEACHGDGDRSNDHLSNLRWGTRQSNSDDRIRHGTVPRPKNSKLNEAQVRGIRRRHARGETYKQLALRYGFTDATSMSAIVRGKCYAWVK